MPYPVAAVRGKNNEAGSTTANETRITDAPEEDRITDDNQVRLTDN